MHDPGGMDQLEQLEASRARLAAIVDNSHDAIFSKTLEGTITSWNAAAERIFGYTAAEVIGRPMALIIPEDRLEEERSVLSRIRTGQLVEPFETARRRKDGQIVAVSLTVSPIKDRHGRIIGASGIARDITENTRAERERAQLFLDLQRANQAKDEFLAMLGHELRNPLNVITVAVDVLAQDPSEAAHAHDIIAEQAAHLKHLVGDLLEVGRVVSGKIRLDLQTFDLGELTREHVAALRTSGTFDRHTVTCEVRPALVQADPQRLRQILDNLIGNALKFTPPGGTIAVQVDVSDDVVALEVRDSGIGMTAELLRSAFDLFVQGHRDAHRAEGGLGLGLTLVRQLVELHHGSVEAFSQGAQQGTRLLVRLPRLRASPTLRPAPKLSRPKMPPQRIVVVEDNKDGREMLRKLLQLSGHEVEEAADGPSGVERILQFAPRIALIDIGLPGFDGHEVARRVRAQQSSEQPPILVALTGYGLEADRAATRAAGFDHHLTKPVGLKDLAKVFHAHELDRE
ncbi:ATP-binding response regulator [Nannocystis bainbridge]|uniref:histidine kinase n=1 Tax=Nannocystis bainbridge TaxID=2995303 RepID=A0ABT5E604_9BACT|nr:PAS domain S-box protein [Nannocystis bainbridge]MDC0721279.1 PAS domain S-box protein [Nannocystis bainbridge]